MKLGEALAVRARQAQAMADLMARIKASSVAQEGTNAPESAMTLIDIYLATSVEHANIVKAIIRTNAATIVADDVTLLDMLQRRELLIRERNVYSVAARAASADSDRFRYTRNEIRMVPTISVQDFRQNEAEVNSQIMALDVAIQKINWETDLLWEVEE